MRIVLILSSLVVLFVAGCRHQVKNDSENRQLEGVGQSIRVSSGDADAAEPAIASSPDGNVYVVWVDHSQDGKADVMFAQCSSRGELQGKAIRVNPQPGVATAWRGDPPTIVVAPDQTIFISWTAKVESETGHATDIYLSSSRDQGHTFSEPVRVNDDKKPAVHGMHSLAVAKDGHIYVAWLDERNIAPLPAVDTKMKQGTSGHHMESNREVFIASSADNGRTFSPNKRVAENVCP
ncbi:MAG TPA: sialidase family protein, partial [Pyrinomonadaceae bacterium]|nr:sialidase family protein [Pyrinomonadaceae bacterium]